MTELANNIVKLLHRILIAGLLMIMMLVLSCPLEAQQLGGNNQIYLIGQITNNINGGPVKNQKLFIFADTTYNPGFSYHNALYTDSEGYFYDTIFTYANKGGLIIFTYDYLNNYHDTTVYFRFNWAEENYFFPGIQLPIEPPQILYQANFYYQRNPSGLDPSEYQFFDITNSEDIISREWDFDDGTYSSEENPTHKFTTTGVYRIMLTVVIKSSPNAIPFTTSMVKIINVTVKSYFFIGGHVMAGYFPIDYGEAYLYKLENKEMVLIDTALFNDSLGFYLFYQVIEGQYIVKADLCPNSIHFNHYMTTYYSNKPFWTEADTIFHQNNNCEYDINLIPVSQSTSGEGKVSGTILYGFDADKGKYAPAYNVEILLLDDNFEPYICSHSDENGTFGFENLGLGDYYIHAEVTGKYTFPVKISLTESHPEISNIMLMIGSYSVNGNVNGTDEHDGMKQIGLPFPNPARNEVNLTIEMNSNEEISISIFSNTGQLINKPYQINTTGTNRINLDTQSLDPGLYFILIRTKEQAVMRKFIKE